MSASAERGSRISLGREARGTGSAAAGTATDELEIRGRDLFLRFARLEDAPALFRLASDPEVTRYFSWGPYLHQSEAEAYIRSLAPKRAEGRMLEFVVVHPQRGLIGVTGLSEFSLRAPGAGARCGELAQTANRRRSCSGSRSAVSGSSG